MPAEIEFTEEIADAICDRLADGQSLRSICAEDGFPSRSTVLRWMNANADFDAKCARARVLQADAMDDMILDTANASTSETAAADRVKIGAYQWRAGRLNPKRYGDRQQVAPTDVDGEPAQFAPIMFVGVEAKPREE